MRRVLAPIAGLVLASTGFSQVPIGGAAFMNLRSKQVHAVVLTKVCDFTHVLGRYTLELHAFAGSSVGAGYVPIAGFTVGKSFKFADQVSAYIGPAVSYSQGSTGPSLGIAAGLTVRF